MQCIMLPMYFCYVDESGDSGKVKSPTSWFVLAAVLVNDKRWREARTHVGNFRRSLRDKFGVKFDAEFRASDIVKNRGDFDNSGMSFPTRKALYEAAMRFQRKCGMVRVFAVAVRKDKVGERNVRDIAWEMAIVRASRFGNEAGENVHFIPDQGEINFITKKIAQMRERETPNIVEDPSERNSRASWFVQFADLNAYAAARKVHPGRNIDGKLWDALGDCRIIDSADGIPEGIQIWG